MRNFEFVCWDGLCSAGISWTLVVHVGKPWIHWTFNSNSSNFKVMTRPRCCCCRKCKTRIEGKTNFKKKIWTDCKTCFGQIVKLFFWQIVKLFPRHKESSSDLQLDHLAFWRKKCIPQRSHLNLTGPKYRHTFTLYQFQTNLTLYWPNQSMPNFSFIISSKV